MKLLCNTVLVNRQCPHLKSSSSKSTLALGFHPPGKENAELFIIHFTVKNKTGVRYKVKDNLERVFTNFVKDGKATISFKVPEHNILITCDPVQLKCFLNALKLGLENKREMNKIGIGTLSMTPIPARNVPSDKMIIQNRSEYPVKGFPRNLKFLSIVGIGREKLPLSICTLSNLRVLNFSDNKLQKLPKDIGRLRLIELNVANNQLGKCSDRDRWDFLASREICHSLQTLDLSNNQLDAFPYKLVKLCKLKILKMDKNAIKRIPFAIRRLRTLRHLSLSENKLESLPESINHMAFDDLNTWGNNFSISHEAPEPVNRTQKKIPPLWELSGRIVISKNLPFNPSILPRDMVDILLEAPRCLCGRLSYSGELRQKAVVMRFNFIKNLTFSREHVIYGDVVLCENEKCSQSLIHF